MNGGAAEIWKLSGSGYYRMESAKQSKTTYRHAHHAHHAQKAHRHPFIRVCYLEITDQRQEFVV